MKIKEKWYTIFFSYLCITIGIVFIATALNFFLDPNTIAPGGVTGLAVVIKRLTNIPIYITNLIINIPLFALGILFLGKVFGIRTFYATVILSLFLKIIPYKMITNDLLLASLFGGIFTGIGMGLVFKFKGTTGGTDLAGAIMNKFFPSFSISTFIMAIDIIVVAIAGIVNKRIEISLYSLIALYITIKIMDLILEGVGYAKGCLIITDKPKEISDAVIEELDRGVTLFKGKGMYSSEEKEVLLCVVTRVQIAKLKQIVSKLDTNAFIMITEVHEVLGEGFKNIKDD